jgi:hypothetical protein
VISVSEFSAPKCRIVPQLSEHHGVFLSQRHISHHFYLEHLPVTDTTSAAVLKMEIAASAEATAALKISLLAWLNGYLALMS